MSVPVPGPGGGSGLGGTWSRGGSWSCGVPGRGVPGPAGVPGPRGAWSWRGAWWGPPRTATAAGGMHPTGMHSCWSNENCLRLVKLDKLEIYLFE